MSFLNPIMKTKEEYTDIIEKIQSVGSAVGIDAQYTHAIIITYLQQISERLDHIEKTLVNRRTAV